MVAQCYIELGEAVSYGQIALREPGYIAINWVWSSSSGGGYSAGRKTGDEKKEKGGSRGSVLMRVRVTVDANACGIESTLVFLQGNMTARHPR